MPTLLLAAAVSDESKAQTILNRIATLATASGDLNIQSVQIGSVQAKEISLSERHHGVRGCLRREAGGDE